MCIISSLCSFLILWVWLTYCLREDLCSLGMLERGSRCDNRGNKGLSRLSFACTNSYFHNTFRFSWNVAYVIYPREI